MKTWEIIKSLVENGRDKKFEDTAGRICYLKTGEIIVEYDKRTSLLDIDEDWELVRKPVDFMTAINSGKKIKYERWIDYYDINRAIEVLIDRPVGTIRSMIDNKWYIED